MTNWLKSLGIAALLCVAMVGCGDDDGATDAGMDAGEDVGNEDAGTDASEDAGEDVGGEDVGGEDAADAGEDTGVPPVDRGPFVSTAWIEPEGEGGLAWILVQSDDPEETFDTMPAWEVRSEETSFAAEPRTDLVAVRVVFSAPYPEGGGMITIDGMEPIPFVDDVVERGLGDIGEIFVDPRPSLEGGTRAVEVTIQGLLEGLGDAPSLETLVNGEPMSLVANVRGYVAMVPELADEALRGTPITFRATLEGESPSELEVTAPYNTRGAPDMALSITETGFRVATVVGDEPSLPTTAVTLRDEAGGVIYENADVPVSAEERVYETFLDGAIGMDVVRVGLTLDGAELPPTLITVNAGWVTVSEDGAAIERAVRVDAESAGDVPVLRVSETARMSRALTPTITGGVMAADGEPIEETIEIVLELLIMLQDAEVEGGTSGASSAEASSTTSGMRKILKTPLTDLDLSVRVFSTSDESDDDEVKQAKNRRVTFVLL